MNRPLIRSANWANWVALRTSARLRIDEPAHLRIRNRLPRERPAPFVAYVATVMLAGAGVLVPALGSLGDLLRLPGGTTAAFWLLFGLAIVVDVIPFATPGWRVTSIVFPSIAFTFTLLIGWGLGPAVLAQAGAVLVSSIRLHHAPWRAAFNGAQYAVSLAAAAAVLDLSRPPRIVGSELEAAINGGPLGSGAWTGLVGAGGIIGAVAAWVLVNEALVTVAVWLRFGGISGAALTRTLRQDVLASLGLLALSPLIGAAAQVGALLVPLTLVPLASVAGLSRHSARAQQAALRDDLTGLPNRKFLNAEVRAQLRSHARRAGHGHDDRRRMGLLLLDIDQFRRVNDALGHAVGDRLLVAVAERLGESVGSDGIVARLGGDEFALFAPRLRDPAAAGVLAQRLADALSAPVVLSGMPLDVTAPIGVALYPDHGTDPSLLMTRAEVAMYDAKDRGAAYAVYTAESDQNTPERLELVGDLRRALEAGRADEIQLHYQPQVDLADGSVVGVEALMRWHHPRRGMVSPEVLIKTAERTPVMPLLTTRVLEEAVTQLAKWRAQGLNLRASVNVSVRDLHRPDFVGHLQSLLASNSVPPNQLELEITEGSLMADPRRVLVTLHKLDSLGVALSLDDFGTGYSSLQHLRRLPLAEVKIDSSFVLGMTTDPDDAAVVGSIVDLGRRLGLRVVAEGVEDDATRQMLIESGCEVGQGWYYARPMPAGELAGWLARFGDGGAHRPAVPPVPPRPRP